MIKYLNSFICNHLGWLPNLDKSQIRSYSASSNSGKEVNSLPHYRKTPPSFVLDTLKKLDIETSNSNYLVNIKTEENIERFVMNEYHFIFGDKFPSFSAGVNVNALGGSVSKYIFEIKPSLEDRLKRLINHVSNLRNKDSSDEFLCSIINNVGSVELFDLCIYYFLYVLTHQESSDDSEESNKPNVYMLPLSIKLGDNIIRKHFRKLRNQSNPENKTFSDWLSNWKKTNRKYDNCLDDSFRSKLGSKLIEIMEDMRIIKKVLIRDKFKKSHYELNIYNVNLLKSLDKQKLFYVPAKLPMIVEPKSYSDTELGGYLLNDVDFREGIFIDKKAYKISSRLAENNLIYKMVNEVSKTPFKINTVLLDYILSDVKHNLVMDPSIEHPYANLDKRTKYQNRVYKSYTSKILLQETIIQICSFFRRFPNIYFPIRIDQRGRSYCVSNYFNYQSNELSKALILFSNPGYVKRNDFLAINFLKAYGANCFGGLISKRSIKAKVEWVDKNIENIIDYDNGILLKRAKDKLLFLAFCIEFKRFYDFYINENQLVFETYLPIQLDATCNGFQHMALLSNETALFEELNLSPSDNSNQEPKDFYNFLLHKVINLLDNKVMQGEVDDTSMGGNYKRLSEFGWDRSHVKKSIMTIPYNASQQTMVAYIKKSLYIDDKKSDQTNMGWYKSSECSKTSINDRDIILLVSCIRDIIERDFEKIKKLGKYLTNVANLYNHLELGIAWSLPSGLNIVQSYLQTRTTTISPFMHSKIKLNIKQTLKDKFDRNKQKRALMPNLIHSLDATSMTLLYNKFSQINSDTQFFAVHDCFGTTADKVFTLKTILASVYTDLYSNEQYLVNFDKYVFDTIKHYRNLEVDQYGREVVLENGEKYYVHSINWVLNKELVDKKTIRRIDSQYLLV